MAIFYSHFSNLAYFDFAEKIFHQPFVKLKNSTIFAPLLHEKHYGRLAQSVQSIWFTPRGSAVRIRQRPHKIACSNAGYFCLCPFQSDATKTNPNNNFVEFMRQL